MAEIVRPTSIDVPSEVRASCIDALNICLANTLYAVLASKFAHWNVKGPGFYPTHLLFDQIYEFYSDAADSIGERITALGGNAEGLLSDVATTSNIIYDGEATDQVQEHIKSMASMLGQIANEYRSLIDDGELSSDRATQDLLITLTREADKQLYFLEAALHTS